MKFIINFILLLYSITTITFKTPPPGNKYTKTLKLPLVENQVIDATIITNSSAIIHLKGFINEKGTINYYQGENDEPEIKMSNNLRQILKMFDSDFLYPKYNE